METAGCCKTVTITHAEHFYSKNLNRKGKEKQNLQHRIIHYLSITVLMEVVELRGFAHLNQSTHLSQLTTKTISVSQ